VIVVDNDSADGSETFITSKFPFVRWLQLGYNAGFARANNAGISIAKGDTVLLLNSDTIVEDDAIQKAYLSLCSSEYVACGVQLLNPDRTPQISGNFFMKGGLNNFLALPYLGVFIRNAGMLFKVKKPNIPNVLDVAEVDWINGAFLMVKMDAISKAGMMDEDFFLYAEEAEWCSRLRKMGRLCIYGYYHVIHLQGETSNIAFGSTGKGYYNLQDKRGLQIMLSNLVRIRKQFGVGWLLFHVLVYLVSLPVIFFAALIHHLWQFKNPFPFASQFAGFAANIFRLLPFVPRIIYNKPYFYKVL
jgi:GT2 family glycosyltransferase